MVGEKINRSRRSKFKNRAIQTTPISTDATGSSTSLKTSHEDQNKPKPKLQDMMKKLFCTKKGIEILRNFISFSFILGILINGSCFSFVVWQIIKCATKYYIEKPIVTSVKMELSKNLSFPAITICGNMDFDSDYRFNKSHLEDVCGIR